MEKTLKYANWLTPFGFQLIPLNSNPADKYYRKRPRDKDWIHKTYSSEQLQAAYRTNWSIGARVPAGYVVIDVDVKEGQQGLQSLALLPQDDLFDGSWVTTGSGGMHIFFRLPEDVEKINTKFRALPGIDFRVVGSQVVCAGSLNKAGGEYVWDDTTLASGSLDIPEIPPAVFEFLTQQPEFSGPSAAPVTKASSVSSTSSTAASAIHANGHIYSGDELRGLLSEVDVTEYREHDDWLKLMMATHESSGGSNEGLEAFWEWSSSEPLEKHRVSRADLERRWKSFDPKAGSTGGITIRSLERASTASARARLDFSPGVLKDAGVKERIEVIGPAGFLTTAINNQALVDLGADPTDFGDESDESLAEYYQASDDIFAQLNIKYSVVLVGGKARITVGRPNLFGQVEYSFLSLADFALLVRTLPKVEVQRGNVTALVSAAEQWLEWSGRREYGRVDFRPGVTQEELDRMYGKGEVLNLWTRWAPQLEDFPNETVDKWDVSGDMCLPSDDKYGLDCAELVRLWYYLCGHGESYEAKVGNKKSDFGPGYLVPYDLRYFVDWLSWSLAFPDSPIGVAMAFQGRKGIGKGVLFQMLQWMAGDNTWVTADMNQVVGQFNGGLRGTIFMCLDEALWSGDKKSARRLQNIITEPIITTEDKGLSSIKTANCLHILLASNDEWIVPASGSDERRYCVYKANPGLKFEFDFWQTIEDKYSLSTAKVAGLLKQGEEGIKVLKARSYRLSGLMKWLMKRGHYLKENGWVPNQKIPRTTALLEQINMDKDPLEIWWDGVIELGELGGVDITTPGPKRVWVSKVKEDFLTSDVGQKATQDRFFGRQGLTIKLGSFLRTKLSNLQRIKATVPEDLRLEVPCSQGKFQGYEYIFYIEESDF